MSTPKFPNMLFCVFLIGVPELMLLRVPIAISSSLDEYMAVGLDVLLGLTCADSVIFGFDGLVDEVALLAYGIGLVVAAGEDLAAGEKLILV